MDKQPVGQLPDLQQSNNDDEIMVITNSEYNQLKKEKISDLITDFTSTNENNALTKGTDGKMFVTDFGNASNITEGTLPVSVLPDIPKDKLPQIETNDLPDSGITAGTYTYPTDIVVNSKGQVTSITEGQAGANNANQDLSNLGPLGLDKLNQSKALETGSVSSDADVFADIQMYAHSTFDKSKFEVVGSPSITDDGIASGFTHSNYVSFSLSLNNTQKIVHYSKYVFKNASRTQVLWSFYTTRLELTTTTVSFKWSDTNIFSGNFKNTLQDDNIIEIFFILNDNGQNKLIAKVNGEESVNITNSTSLAEYSLASIRIGDYSQIDNLYFTGSIDLKSFAFWADGIPVFNGNKTGTDTIEGIDIPYTLSKTGSKIVDAAYRDRVKDVYEQYGYAPYYTIDEENQNFTLPAGEVYGMISNTRDFSLNKTQITNCILSAPNGVATFSGNSLTLKSGLKILCCDGLNSDGTLKNSEVILDNDVTRDFTGLATGLRYIAYNKTTNGIFYYNTYFVSNSEPTIDTSKSEIWYNPQKNFIYVHDANGDIWTKVTNRCVLGTIFNSSTGTEFNIYQPVELLKRTDKEQITSWSFPSSKYIDLTLGASGSSYTAPAAGWVSLVKITSAPGQNISLIREIDGEIIRAINIAPTTGQEIGVLLPVTKGAVFEAGYTAGGQLSSFRFYYAEGARND